MAPKSKKNRNNKKNGSSSNLKKKVVSPKQSNESLVTNSAQSNSMDSINSAAADLDLDAILAQSANDLSALLDTNIPKTITSSPFNNEKPESYEITTTYKTEMVECSVDPDTGEIVEVVTEIYITDEMNLKKEVKEEPVIPVKPVEIDANPISVDNLDLDEVLKQLNMGTEICKELLG